MQRRAWQAPAGSWRLETSPSRSIALTLAQTTTRKSCRDGMVGHGNPVQAKVERRPFSYSALRPNLTSVALNDSLHRCQSYSGSRKILWLVKTLEGPKQLVSVFHIEPGAIVSYEIRHRPIS